MTAAQSFVFITFVLPVLMTLTAFLTWMLLTWCGYRIGRWIRKKAIKRQREQWKKDLLKNDPMQYLHGRVFDEE